jgi:hypothetical protein
MHDLQLRFAGGLVEGEGRDVVGRFTFHGTYDDQGGVYLVKQYLRTEGIEEPGNAGHQVTYMGTYDGEGTIFGRWSIQEDRTSGPFALAPVRGWIDSDAAIEAVGHFVESEES